MIDRYQVIPAAYVIMLREVDGDTQLLLQLRRNTGYRDGHWATAAAGHVEAGESVVQAAHREAAEELGVTIDPGELIPVTTMHRSQGNGDPYDERVDVFFTCRVWHGEPHRVEPHKTADLAWFALDALPHPVVPHERLVFEALRSGQVPPVLVLGFGQPNSSG